MTIRIIRRLHPRCIGLVCPQSVPPAGKAQLQILQAPYLFPHLHFSLPFRAPLPLKLEPYSLQLGFPSCRSTSSVCFLNKWGTDTADHDLTQVYQRVKGEKPINHKHCTKSQDSAFSSDQERSLELFSGRGSCKSCVRKSSWWRFKRRSCIKITEATFTREMKICSQQDVKRCQTRS